MLIKKIIVGISIVLAVITLAPTAVFAELAGCPGGPVGPTTLGTFCPDGSVPSPDPFLPLKCPGSSKAGPIPATGYTVVCPARPGRAECTYTESTKKCLDENNNDVTAGDAKATSTNGQTLDPDGQKIYDGLAKLINALSALVGIIVIISIVFAGIQYTTAGGDPQKVSAAKSRMVNSVMAFFVFIFIYAFLQYLVPGGIF